MSQRSKAFEKIRSFLGRCTASKHARIAAARREAAARPQHIESWTATGFEPLEPRVLLTAVWDGGGADDLWSNELNWAPNRVPRTDEDVVIAAERSDGSPIPSDKVIFDLPGTTTIGRIVSDLPFEMAAGSGTLEVTDINTFGDSDQFNFGALFSNSLTLLGGTIDTTEAQAHADVDFGLHLKTDVLDPLVTGQFSFQGGAVLGDIVIEGSGLHPAALDLGASFTDSINLTFRGVDNTLTGDIKAGQTITVQGTEPDAFSFGVLKLAPDSGGTTINLDGTIRLDAKDLGVVGDPNGAVLNVGINTLQINTGGLIEALNGDTVLADRPNSREILLGPDGLLLDPDGVEITNESTFGAIGSGDPVTEESTGLINIGGTSVTGVWVGTRGGGDGVNWSDTDNWSGGVLPGPDDHVTINVLQRTDDPVTEPDPTIIIDVDAGSIQSLKAFEDVTFESGGSLTVTGTHEFGFGAIFSKALTMNGGSLDATGVGVLMSSDRDTAVFDNGMDEDLEDPNPGLIDLPLTLDLNGGTIVGGVTMVGLNGVEDDEETTADEERGAVPATADFAPGYTDAIDLTFWGANNHLVGDLAAGQTLNIEGTGNGDAAFGVGILFLDGSTTNAGTINLNSHFDRDDFDAGDMNGTQATAAVLDISAHTLINATGGVIQGVLSPDADANHPGLRQVAAAGGMLVNQGELTADDTADLILSGLFTPSETPGADPTIDPLIYQIDGGIISSPVFFSNTDVVQLTDHASASTVNLIGINNRLLTDNLANTTLRPVGGDTAIVSQQNLNTYPNWIDQENLVVATAAPGESALYEIPTTLFAGTTYSFVLVNDDDGGAGSDSVFSNLEFLQEVTAGGETTLETFLEVDFNDATIETWGDDGDPMFTPTPSVDGDSLTLSGNLWKKITINIPADVSGDAILRFEFASTTEGEFHGIGVPDLTTNTVPDDVRFARIFQLYGTQGDVDAVLPADNFGSGFLTLAPSVGTEVTNFGTIQLDWEDFDPTTSLIRTTSSHLVLGGHTLINEGTIEAIRSGSQSGGRIIEGDGELINRGAITAFGGPPALFLEINGDDPTTTDSSPFTQDDIETSTYTPDGGTLNDRVFLRNMDLDLTLVDPGDSPVIQLVGRNVFSGDTIPSNVELHVIGASTDEGNSDNDGFSHALLTLQSPVTTLEGDILLTAHDVGVLEPADMLGAATIAIGDNTLEITADGSVLGVLGETPSADGNGSRIIERSSVGVINVPGTMDIDVADGTFVSPVSDPPNTGLLQIVTVAFAWQGGAVFPEGHPDAGMPDRRWSTEANWPGGELPGADDDVVINIEGGGGPIIIDSDVGMVRSLRVFNASVVFDEDTDAMTTGALEVTGLVPDQGFGAVFTRDLTMNAGTLTVANGVRMSSDADTTLDEGVFDDINVNLNLNGGTIVSDVTLVGTQSIDDDRGAVIATVNIGDMYTEAIDLTFWGSNNILTGDVADGQIIQVEGTGNADAAFGTGQLSLGDPLTNNGQINLVSHLDLGAGVPTAAVLNIGLHTLTVGATGSVNALLGEIAPRIILSANGTLVNEGALNAEEGLLEEDPDAIFIVSGNFEPANPITEAPAVLEPITYNIVGGSIAGPVFFANTDIRQDADPSAPSEVNLVGVNNRLRTDNFPNSTLRVLGTEVDNDTAPMDVSPDAFFTGLLKIEPEIGSTISNFGTIILDSQDIDPSTPAVEIASSAIEVVGDTTFINSMTGIIHAAMGAGGGRSINLPAGDEMELNAGTLENRGTDTEQGVISAEAGVTLFINGDNPDTPVADTDGLSVVVNGNVQNVTVSGYSTQDQPESTAVIEGVGNETLRVTGNGWKKVAFDSPVTITEDTVLTFDFSSSVLAELQGIGFDSDEDVVNEGTIFFQVSGTDSAFPNLNGNFHDYPQGGMVGDTVSYTIPVGDFITGEYSFLTFFNDDDVAPQNGQSVFTNVTLSEAMFEGDAPQIETFTYIAAGGTTTGDVFLQNSVVDTTADPTALPSEITVIGFNNTLVSTTIPEGVTINVLGTEVDDDTDPMDISPDAFFGAVLNIEPPAEDPATVTLDGTLVLDARDIDPSTMAEAMGRAVVNLGENTLALSPTGFINALTGDTVDLGGTPENELVAARQILHGETGGVLDEAMMVIDDPGDSIRVTTDPAELPELLFIGLSPGEGAVWEGGTDNLWSTASNWREGVVPGSDDHVTIEFNPDEDPIVQIDIPVTIRSLRAFEGVLITGTGSLTLTDEILTESGSFPFRGLFTKSLEINGGSLDSGIGDSPMSGIQLSSDADGVDPDDPMDTAEDIEIQLILTAGAITGPVTVIGTPALSDNPETTDSNEAKGAVKATVDMTGFTAALDLTFQGTNNELVGDTVDGQTITILGSGDLANGFGIVKWEGGTNAGTVQLQSLAIEPDPPVLDPDTMTPLVPNPTGAILDVGAGTLINAPTGVITGLAGEGGVLTITGANGTIINQGDDTNQGEISVAMDEVLFINGDDPGSTIEPMITDPPPVADTLAVGVNGVGQNLAVTGYSTQDKPESTAAIEGADNKTLRITGNGWKKVAFAAPVTITESTVLSFDFSSPMLAELQGIGFDSDEDVVNEGTIFFQVAGTDSAFPNLNRVFADYPQGGLLGDTVSYTIPVGEFITGEYSFLTFFNDDDVAPSDGVSVFSNVRLFEPVPDIETLAYVADGGTTVGDVFLQNSVIDTAADASDLPSALSVIGFNNTLVSTTIPQGVTINVVGTEVDNDTDPMDVSPDAFFGGVLVVEPPAEDPVVVTLDGTIILTAQDIDETTVPELMGDAVVRLGDNTLEVSSTGMIQALVGDSFDDPDTTGEDENELDESRQILHTTTSGGVQDSAMTPITAPEESPNVSEDVPGLLFIGLEADGVVWDGGGTDDLWTNPENWQLGVVPGPNDDVIIPLDPEGGVEPIVLINTNITVRTLRAFEQVEIATGGSLTLTSVINDTTLPFRGLFTHTLHMNGGTLDSTFFDGMGEAQPSGIQISRDADSDDNPDPTDPDNFSLNLNLVSGSIEGPVTVVGTLAILDDDETEIAPEDERGAVEATVTISAGYTDPDLDLIFQGSNNILIGDIAELQTVTIQGTGDLANGFGTLNWVNGTNDGTVRLQSLTFEPDPPVLDPDTMTPLVPNPTGAVLDIGIGTTTNNGTITTLPGDDGVLSITGSGQVNHLGTIDVQGGDQTLQVQPDEIGSRIAFHLDGGSTEGAGPVALINADLTFGASPSTSATLTTLGPGNTLGSDVPEGVTIELLATERFDTIVRTDYGVPNGEPSEIYLEGSGDQTYVIPLGEFFVGDFQFLTFVQDADTFSAPGGRVGRYSSITFHNVGPAGEDTVTIDFDDFTIESYTTDQDDDASSAHIEDDGNLLRIVGNAWKKIDLADSPDLSGSIMVHPESTLEFTFNSAGVADLNGIGLDSDDDPLNSNTQIFQFAGVNPVTSPPPGNFGFNPTEGSFGNAVLTLLSDVSLSGTLRMDSVADPGTEAGDVGATVLSLPSGLTGHMLTITDTGLIEVLEGAGGNREVIGGNSSLINQGSITVEGTTRLVMNGDITDPTFAPEGVTERLTYDSAGGTIDGPGYLVNTDVGISVAPSEPTDLKLVGFGNRLHTDNPANMNLRIIGSGLENFEEDNFPGQTPVDDISPDGFGHAVLTLIPDGPALETLDTITNHGVITLEAFDLDDSTTEDQGLASATLDLGSANLTNASDGLIDVKAGGGNTREIRAQHSDTGTGTFRNEGDDTNQGTVSVEPDTFLAMTGTDISDIEEPPNFLPIRYEAAGGQLGDRALLTHSLIDLDDAEHTPGIPDTEIQIVGFDNTLVSDVTPDALTVPAGITLRVLGTEKTTVARPIVPDPYNPAAGTDEVNIAFGAFFTGNLQSLVFINQNSDTIGDSIYQNMLLVTEEFDELGDLASRNGFLIDFTEGAVKEYSEADTIVIGATVATFTIESYTDNDGPGTADVGMDGSLTLSGNAWKKIVFSLVDEASPIAVNANMVLNFDYTGNADVEFQAIGTDDDDNIENALLFYLAGQDVDIDDAQIPLDAFGNSVLTLSAPTNNLGNIILDSMDLDPTTMPPPLDGNMTTNFINAAVIDFSEDVTDQSLTTNGVLDVLPGAGGSRIIDAEIHNSGQFTIGTDTEVGQLVVVEDVLGASGASIFVGEAGFSIDGVGWGPETGDPPFRINDLPAGDGGFGDRDTATWQFDGLDEEATYTVYATWPAPADGEPTRATDAFFEIQDVTDTGNLISPISIDQTGSSNSNFDNGDGFAWEEIGAITLSTGSTSLQVFLSDQNIIGFGNPTGAVVAHGILVVKDSAGTTPTTLELPDFEHTNTGDLTLEDDATLIVRGAKLINEVGGTLGGSGKFRGVLDEMLPLDPPVPGTTNPGPGLINNGVITPGGSTGILNIQSNFEQTTGEIQIEIDGTTPGEGHDQLNIAGDRLVIEGTLSVNNLNESTPAVGDEFDVLTFTPLPGGAAPDLTLVGLEEVGVTGVYRSIDHIGIDTLRLIGSGGSLNVTVNDVEHNLPVVSYSTQDKPSATVAIEDEGDTVRITGNGWKKVVFDSPITITGSTVLSFDYSSTALAELQGIGFDNDEEVTNEGTKFFQVSGTDDTFPNLMTFAEYPDGGSLGDVVHYEIQIGDFITGEFSFLTFFNDDDVVPQDGVSVFSNIELFERPLAVNVGGTDQNLDVVGYSDQDTPDSEVVVNDGGARAIITGNGWKKVVFDTPVTITEDTMLTFDFSSSMLAELQGIGFDSDEDVTNEGTIFFQVAGTDGAFPNLNRDFHDYPRGGTDGDTVSYEIPVGTYITGEFSFLTFFNDHDVIEAEEPVGQSIFSNIQLFQPIPTLDVTVNEVDQTLEVVSYSSQDDPSSTVMSEGSGSGVRITGNGWKKVVFDAPVTITPDTVLTFDFSSSMLAELQGIGFDSDEDVVNEGTIFFQVAGTDSAFPNLNRDFADYPQGGVVGDTVSYTIPVGTYITGEYSFLTFFNDDDIAPQDGVSVFTNVTLFEDTPVEPMDILAVSVNGSTQDLEVVGYSTQDQPTSEVSIEGTSDETLRVTGNGWKKVVFDSPVMITADTVLTFDFSSSMLAELQGIGFDSDEDVTNEGTIFFQVAGTDDMFPNLNRDFADYPQGGVVGDTVPYRIPVGQYITGEYSFLTFFNDDDIAPQDGQSVFTNVTLFEDPSEEMMDILTVSVNGSTQDLEVVGYSTQDQPTSEVSIEGTSDETLRVTGNGWKKVVFDAPVTITPDTVLTFDFSSSMLAELQGIGFDSDEDVVNEGTIFFQVAGTDSAFPNLNRDFADYPQGGVVGDTVSYTIPVGTYITGEYSFLTFFNDDDIAPQDGVSVFTNVTLFEDTPVEPMDILAVSVNGSTQDLEVVGYSTQDQSTSEVSIEGTSDETLRVTGNGWKKVVFDAPVTITADTVLTFDFSSSMLAELQGIGFDSDEDVVNEGTIFFQVAGTDSAFPNLNRDFADYPQGGVVGDTVSYTIPVGTYITGEYSFLTFFNDDDIAPQDGVSVFTNVTLFEDTPVEPDGLSVTVNNITSFLDVVGYSSQDNGGGTAAIEAAGDKIRLTGNNWKKVIFESPITITENTVLSFDFSSSAEAELHGIGVDSDEDVTNAGTQYFNLFGTDTAFPNLNFDFDNYPQEGSIGDVVPYSIPIGQFVTGTFDFLVFFTDKDVGDKSVGESVFSDIEFFEGLEVTVNGEAQYAPLESYSTQDSPGSAVSVLNNSTAVQVTGNGWKKFDFDAAITVTANTVLAFDYSSTSIGELQGIGLDSDDDVTNASTAFFQIFGSDSAFPNLITDFADYPQGGSVGDTVHYEINIGAFVTGTFEFLTFFNDDDIAPQDSNSLFSNISIFEMS